MVNNLNIKNGLQNDPNGPDIKWVAPCFHAVPSGNKNQQLIPIFGIMKRGIP